MGAAGKQGELELDYLAAEARDARIAMRASLLDLKASLLTKADPRELAREHPRIAVGLAAAVGIAAGTALGARRGRRMTSAVAPLVPPAAQTPPSPDQSLHGDGRRPGPARAARGKFATWLLGMIQGALGGALRLAIESALASWAAAAAQDSQGSSEGISVPRATPEDEDVSKAEKSPETEAAVESPPCVTLGAE